MIQYDAVQKAILIEAYEEYVARISVGKADDNIARFLKDIESIDLSDSRKLIGLAAATTHRIGWSDVCEIYKKAIQYGGPREGIYINWLESALSLLTNDMKCERTERIILESFEILKNAMLSHPRHSGFAYLSGLFNYKYSKLITVDPNQLDKALAWFHRAEEWQLESHHEVDDRIKYYIGQCYFELHEWKKSIEYFEGVNKETIECEEGQESLNQLINNVLLAKDFLNQPPN